MDWSPLRIKIQGSCIYCEGSGYVNDLLCNCAIKFRAYNRMVRGGFHEYTLDFITGGSYSIPMLENGLEAIQYFVANPDVALERGLSFYIFSKENGRGKTTLAHYLVYVLLWHFSKTENYSPNRKYMFESIHSLCKKFRSGHMDEIANASVLVIDDIGMETRLADWKKENNITMLHEILYQRKDQRLVTILTSNYEPSVLAGFYGSVLDSILEIQPDGRIGGHLYRQVEVGGAEDFRLSFENSEWPV